MLHYDVGGMLRKSCGVLREHAFISFQFCVLFSPSLLASPESLDFSVDCKSLSKPERNFHFTLSLLVNIFSDGYRLCPQTLNQMKGKSCLLSRNNRR